MPLLEIVPTVLFPPTIEFTLQVTEELVELVTAAVYVAAVPSRTWLLPDTVTCGG